MQKNNYKTNLCRITKLISPHNNSNISRVYLTFAFQLSAEFHSNALFPMHILYRNRRSQSSDRIEDLELCHILSTYTPSSALKYFALPLDDTRRRHSPYLWQYLQFVLLPYLHEKLSAFKVLIFVPIDLVCESSTPANTYIKKCRLFNFML